MKISFSEVFADETKNGTKLKTCDYQTSGTYPIIDQGQDFIAGYTDSVNGLYTNVPAIIFGDHTRVLKYVDFPFFLGADGAKILKSRSAHTNYKYLYYALKSVRIPDTGYNRHFKWLKEAAVSIPNSQKQESIVFTLDSISRIISHRRAQLAKLDELVKCRFVEMFGDWKTNPLNLPQISGKELFVFSSGKFLSSDKRKECGVPVYGGNGIAWYTDKPLIQEPTIIIGRVGAFCGNIHSTKQPVWITDNAIYIKHCKKEIDHVFLTELMTQMDFHQYADFSGQSKITQKPLEEMKYILPTLEQQNAFASFVHRIDKLRFVASDYSLREENAYNVLNLNPRTILHDNQALMRYELLYTPTDLGKASPCLAGVRDEVNDV